MQHKHLAYHLGSDEHVHSFTKSHYVRPRKKIYRRSICDLVIRLVSRSSPPYTCSTPSIATKSQAHGPWVAWISRDLWGLACLDYTILGALFATDSASGSFPTRNAPVVHIHCIPLTVWSTICAPRLLQPGAYHYPSRLENWATPKLSSIL